MGMPEQHNEEGVPLDLQKEQIGQILYQVRFGLGPHTLRFSDWHELIVQDLDYFFQSTETIQRNIFFSEDALGSQSYLDKVRAAYKHYGKYTTALAYARHYRLRDGFSTPQAVEGRYKDWIQTQHPFASDGARFVDKVFRALDGIIEKKGITIDIETEKRKDPKERQQIEKILMQAQLPRPRSADEFRQHTLGIWNMRRIRDRKIVDDLTELYKKAIRKNEPTKVYVSLGQNHSGVNEMLTAKFNKRPSQEISVVRGGLHHPQREVFSEAVALLDIGVPISLEQWQSMFERSIRTS